MKLTSAPSERLGELTVRNAHGLAYDAAGERVLLFGGHDGPRVFGDTWLWDGDAWTLAQAAPPRPRLDNGH